mmetsp:Transcript_24029/g.77522  ORF Transcript_24029/g.77522 Transcript_24029/m.77522 type:complete len:206 (+) Transcript_24029:47-664(+)
MMSMRCIERRPPRASALGSPDRGATLLSRPDVSSTHVCPVPSLMPVDAPRSREQQRLGLPASPLHVPVVPVASVRHRLGLRLHILDLLHHLARRDATLRRLGQRRRHVLVRQRGRQRRRHLPIDLVARDSRFFREDGSDQPVVQRRLGRALVELGRVVLVVDVVAYPDELALAEEAAEQDHRHAEQIMRRDLERIGRVGLEDNLV